MKEALQWTEHHVSLEKLAGNLKLFIQLKSTLENKKGNWYCVNNHRYRGQT